MKADMQRPRRHCSPEQKVNILRQHLIERTPLSDLCDQHGIAPTLFYQRQKTFFEKGPTAFESGRSPSRGVGQSERNLAALEIHHKFPLEGYRRTRLFRNQPPGFFSIDAEPKHDSFDFPPMLPRPVSVLQGGQD
jgi:transposase-like protein